MLCLRKPRPRQIDEFLRQQQGQTYSYACVSGTDGHPPTGFSVDRNRVCLGTGEATYHAACEALRRWQMFPTGWTEIVPSDRPPRTGEVVAMLARCLGFWWLNSCRIVYVFDEAEPSRRFGFAYGTLPSHVECGEERFSVTWEQDDTVWYEIYSFSRPNHWLVRCTYPLARYFQQRFVRQSLEQMRQLMPASNAQIVRDDKNDSSSPTSSSELVAIE